MPFEIRYSYYQIFKHIESSYSFGLEKSLCNFFAIIQKCHNMRQILSVRSPKIRTWNPSKISIIPISIHPSSQHRSVKD